MPKKIFALLFMCATAHIVAHPTIIADHNALLEAAQQGNIRQINKELLSATAADVAAQDENGKSVIFLLAQHAQNAEGDRKEKFLDLIRAVSQRKGAPVKDLAQFKDPDIRTLFDEELNFGQSSN